MSFTGIPHRCPWCGARCNCGAEPAAIEECTHDCDAIDDDDEYTAADITAAEEAIAYSALDDAGYALPEDFPDDGEQDYSDEDVVT